jgi:UDPglucose 6-dehydrogenase
MCSDKRIGNQFLYPGLGYGGSCFPKDVLAVISMGQEAEMPASLLSAVHGVNQRQREQFFAKVEKHFSTNGQLGGKKIAVWGIAFKPGTDDIREAPSITLMKKLLERGATIVAYDPVASEPCEKVFGPKVHCAADPMQTLEGAEALIICTDWDEFRHPDFDEMKKRMNKPVVFDGRNLYRLESMKDAGFTYYSVGREAVRS